MQNKRNEAERDMIVHGVDSVQDIFALHFVGQNVQYQSNHLRKRYLICSEDLKSHSLRTYSFGHLGIPSISSAP